MMRHVVLLLGGVLAVLTLTAFVRAAEPAAPASEATKKPSPAARPAEQPTAPPFALTTEEQKGVDRVLNRWEQWNSRVKTFDCRFKTWVYDSVFGTLDQPQYIELGSIKYSAPDRIEIKIDAQEKDGMQTPIEDSRANHWMFDGKTIWEYRQIKMQVIEHKILPELKGSRFVDGPLSFAFPIQGYSWAIALLGLPTDPSPFPFGSKAEELKRQYYIRKITPPDAKGQVWLEAYPRSRHQAGCFQRLELIFVESDVSPFALKIVQPNGKDYTVYQFYDIKINEPSTQTKDTTFHPLVPPGWQMIHDSPHN